MDRLLSMKVFQQVADEGGFAAAARALDLSAAAVTRLVADLEAGLGVRLLHRTTRRVTLTSAGDAYLDRVRRILQEIEEADAQATSHANELSGELRISATPALATHVLAPLMAGFRARYPNVRLDIEVGVGGERAIEDHDLTLFGAEAGFDANVIARAILETDAVLVASPGYLRRRGMPQRPEELQGHELLVARIPGERGGVLRLWPAGQTGQQVTLDISPALSANNVDTLLRAVLADAGITAFPLDLVAPYLTNGHLVRVLSPWVTGRLTMYAALPSRRFIPERTRRFLDHLIEQTRLQTASALEACDACFAQWQVPPLAPRSGIEFVEAHAVRDAGTGLQGPLLLDVRGPASQPRPDNDLAGALRADLGRVAMAVQHLPPDTPIVTLCACQGDAGAVDAAHELQAAGYRAVRVLRGGLAAWRQFQQQLPEVDRSAG